VAFLDGTQRYEVMSYASTTPVVVAEVAAAVMERREKTLYPAEEGRRRLVIARPSVLDSLGDLVDDHETVALSEDTPAHPVQEFELASRVVDQAAPARNGSRPSVPQALLGLAHRGRPARGQSALGRRSLA
jgi:hypothetical protein